MTAAVGAGRARSAWSRGWFGKRRLPTDVVVFVIFQLALVVAICGFCRYHGIGLASLSYRFRKWDASWLLSIAHHGYQTSGARRRAIAFFPLYPGLVRIAMIVCHKDVVAAFGVSFVSSVIGHTLFFRALRSRTELTACATSAVILLLAWPVTIYFSLLYTEGLYLALTAGFLYFLFEDRVGLAAGAAALAALTRQPGFLCVVPLSMWIVTDTSRAGQDRVRRLAWLALAASGYSAFLLINRIVYGRWFAFVDALRVHWGKRTAPLTATIPDGIGFLRSPTWYFGWTNLADYYLVLAALGIFIAWPVICRHRFERCRWVLLAWGLAQWFLIASSSSSKLGVGWLSSTRYLMLVLPLFVAIADLARNRRWIISPLVASGVVCAAMALNRWVTKQWTA